MSVHDITSYISPLFQCEKDWNLEEFKTRIQEGAHKLRVIVPAAGRFGIVRYVKGQSDFTHAETGYARSIVFEKDTGRVVCVAPSKSASIVMNEWKIPQINDWDNIVCAEEFMDGTMINLFQLAGDSTIHIATRSRIGGDTTFYAGGPSFEKMLRDACPQLDTFFEGQHLDGFYSRFASILLQHPSNRIVVPIAKPAMYVVMAGMVSTDGIIHVDNGAFADYRPPRVDISYIQSMGIHRWLQDRQMSFGIATQGVVLYRKDGTRLKYRTQLYNSVRELRGNESLAYERFARIRKANALRKYIHYYPEDKEVFYDLEGRLRTQTHTLYKMYADTFITRTLAFASCPWPFKHHVSVLHNIYKETLKGRGCKIGLDQVVSYVNSLSVEDTANLLKLVKEKNKDTAASETTVESTAVTAP